MIIKQYGLQRSGTNYAKALIENNLDIRVMSNGYGRKHEKFNFNFNKLKNYNIFEDKYVKTDLTKKQFLSIHKEVMNNNIIFLIIFKHPFKWIESYFRYVNRKNNLTLKDCEDIFIEKSCIKWNDYNMNWYSNIVLNNELKSFVVFYDTLIKKQGHYIAHLEADYGIRRLSDCLIDVERKMWAGTDKTYKDIDINLNKIGYENRYEYLNMDFKKAFLSRHRKIIRNTIDFNLFENLKLHSEKCSRKKGM